jgi:hypothetical protein
MMVASSSSMSALVCHFMSMAMATSALRCVGATFAMLGRSSKSRHRRHRLLLLLLLLLLMLLLLLLLMLLLLLLLMLLPLPLLLLLLLHLLLHLQDTPRLTAPHIITPYIAPTVQLGRPADCGDLADCGYVGKA